MFIWSKKVFDYGLGFFFFKWEISMINLPDNTGTATSNEPLIFRGLKLSSPADLSVSKKLHFDSLETTSADVQAAIQVSEDNRKNSNSLTSVAKLSLTSPGPDFTPTQICANPCERAALCKWMKIKSHFRPHLSAFYVLCKNWCECIVEHLTLGRVRKHKCSFWHSLGSLIFDIVIWLYIWYFLNTDLSTGNDSISIIISPF